MKLKIEAVYGNNKARKSATMDVPDEVTKYFIELFKANNSAEFEEERPVVVEGGRSIKINLSVLHAETKL